MIGLYQSYVVHCRTICTSFAYIRDTYIYVQNGMARLFAVLDQHPQHFLTFSISSRSRHQLRARVEHTADRFAHLFCRIHHATIPFRVSSCSYQVLLCKTHTSSYARMYILGTGYTSVPSPIYCWLPHKVVVSVRTVKPYIV